MTRKFVLTGRIVLALVCCQISFAQASTDKVESRFCLYTDIPGMIGMQTGVWDLAFMLLTNTRPEYAFGLNGWQWYYDKNEKYYQTVVQGTGSVPSAFNAWEINFTADLIIPFSYMHAPIFLSPFKQPTTLSFSGWVLGVSPGVTAYVPRGTGHRTDVFRTYSPYFGLQGVAAKHFYIGARLGYQWAWHLGQVSFVEKIENRWFASLILGAAWREKRTSPARSQQ